MCRDPISSQGLLLVPVALTQADVVRSRCDRARMDGKLLVQRPRRTQDDYWDTEFIAPNLTRDYNRTEHDTFAQRRECG